MAKTKKGSIKDASIKNGSGNTIANYYNYHQPVPEIVWPEHDKTYVLENVISSQDREIQDLERQVAYLGSLLENARQEVKILRAEAVKCRCMKSITINRR